MNPPRIKPPRQTLYVGIDPGMKGAIGAITADSQYFWCWSLPVNGTGRKGEFDLVEMCRIIKSLAHHDCRVFMEFPTTRPGESPESSKRFGVGMGNVEMGFAMIGHPITRVSPANWKGDLGLKGKDTDPLAARLQAVEAAEGFIGGLPPSALRGPKGGLLDGKAEALLIAWWALTKTHAGLASLDIDTRLARVSFGKKRRRGAGGVHL